MPHCDCNKIIEQFQQFRQKLYAIIPHRRDAVMDLIDALSSNQTAHSTVEVTLNPLFKRNYSTFYKAIQQFKFNLGDMKDSLSVLVADSDYSSPSFLKQNLLDDNKGLKAKFPQKS